MISEQVHRELIRHNMSFATAESCTGGALSASLVRHPDASRYYVGSIIAYTNQVKIDLLAVQPKTLEIYGAVSEEVTKEMALGVAKKLLCRLSVGVSGILGPTGAVPGKPVGTVCASIALDGKIVRSWTMHHQGSRQEILEQTVEEILGVIYQFLQEKGPLVKKALL